MHISLNKLATTHLKTECFRDELPGNYLLLMSKKAPITYLLPTHNQFHLVECIQTCYIANCCFKQSPPEANFLISNSCFLYQINSYHLVLFMSCRWGICISKKVLQE